MNDSTAVFLKFLGDWDKFISDSEAKELYSKFIMLNGKFRLMLVQKISNGETPEKIKQALTTYLVRQQFEVLSA